MTKKTYGWRPNGIWGTNPLFQTQNGNYYLYHNDNLGKPQKLTDVPGVIAWGGSNETFGKVDIDPSSTIINNLRFPGQYFDQETGLHYNWNRYYDPGVGRYIEADPIAMDGGINFYSYAFANPLTFIDQYGLKGTGHHIIPWELFDGKVSQAVQQLWDSADARIFNEHYKTHNGKKINGLSHYKYSRLVQEELEKFLAKKGTCLKKLTQSQAEEFLAYLLQLSSDSKISMFLSGIRQEAAEAAFKASLKTSMLSAAGKAAKIGGKILGPLGFILGEITDARAAGGKGDMISDHIK